MGALFIPSRCARIDTIGSNVLIRGNMPLLGSDLHYALHEIQEASGVDLSHRRIIDVPIIDNVGERHEFSAILKAFGLDADEQFPESLWPWWQHPNYDYNALHGTKLHTGGKTRTSLWVAEQSGSVLWRPFEGLPPNTPPKEFLGAPGWDYVGFLDQVIHLTKTLQNAAIYVHCQLGADRTGAFHTGYLMKTMGLSLAEAASMANGSTSAGAPNADYRRLLEAYAASL